MASSSLTRNQDDATHWLGHLMKELDRYRRRALFCDTELQTNDGCHLYGHSSILAACSPVLHQQFLQSKPGVYIVQVPIQSTILECVLNYVYTGRWDLLGLGCDLHKVEDAVQILGLQRCHRWRWSRKSLQKQPARPQRCLHGKPKCKKRKSGLVCRC